MTDAERLDLTIQWLRSAAKVKRASGQRSIAVSLRAAEEIATWLGELREMTSDWEELAS